MKIAAISDTHSFHRKIKMPESADVLVACGDLSFKGEPKVLYDFVNWLGEQTQITHKLVIFGNHELYPEDDPAFIPLLFDREVVKAANIHYLQDSGITIDGINFYGSPWQPWFHDWAWNFPERDNMRDFQFANSIWNKIPEDTHVLLTHGPPRGILDDLHDRDERAGCPVLRKRLGELPELKAHCFGHLHRNAEDHKTEIHDGVIYANVATCDEQYKPINPVVVFDIEV
jgi:Icc-related predicted phosphoesterase